MAKVFHSGFSRNLPDVITEELVGVLSGSASFGFKALFSIVHANLRLRKCANGGEEMLRLRAYEKLQSLVYRGMVSKLGKEYRGLASLASAIPVLLPPPAVVP